MTRAVADPADLTIIIPTQNRSFFLTKVLEYWAQQGCRYPIMIGDASTPEEYALNQRLVERYGDRLALHHEKHSSTISGHASAVALLQGVNTPYTVFCGDDDFLVPGRLGECVEFLRSHGDYALACGIAAWVYVDETADHRFRVSRIGPGSQQAIRAGRPSTRMVEWVYPTRSINSFSVQRTENMRANWDRAARLGLDSAGRVDAPLYEICVNVLAVIQGKQAVVPGLYHVMPRHTRKQPGVGAFDRLTRWDWSKQIGGMVACWAEEAAKREDLDCDRAHAVAKAVFLSWLIPYISRYRDNRLRENGLLREAALSQKPVRQVIGAVPGTRRIVRAVRRLLAREEISLASLLNPRSAYHADFMPIYRILTTAADVP